MAIGIPEIKLYTVLREDAIDRIEAAHPGILAANIAAAEAWAASALRNKYSPPIEEAKQDAFYVAAICKIAIESPGLKYGLPPNNPSMRQELKDDAKLGREWFTQLGTGEKKYDPTADQTPNRDETGPFAGYTPRTNLDILNQLRTVGGCGCR